MNNPESNPYNKVATIIETMQADFKEFNLNEIAEKVNLSPVEIQQLFKDWADVDVEQFWKYLHIQHAKETLNETQPTLFDSAEQVKKMKNARIHESFVEIEAINPSDVKKGEKLNIHYSFNDTIFGEVLIASTNKGICYMGFADDHQKAFSEIEKRFPKATFIQQTNEIQQNTLLVFSPDWTKIKKIKLHLQGTDFQIQVWKKLLQIPTGDLTTYGKLAMSIQKPKAARAVGTAIGSNPIAFLIPCHRVIQTSGALGGYMWGNTRKLALIGWEASQK